MGMFAEAGDALEQLPDDLKQAPAALRIQMRVAAAFGRWDMARGIADTLRHGTPADREDAASCYQSVAAEHYKHGRVEEARTLLRRAIGTWSGLRAQILVDKRFATKFIEQFKEKEERREEF